MHVINIELYLLVLHTSRFKVTYKRLKVLVAVCRRHSSRHGMTRLMVMCDFKAAAVMWCRVGASEDPDDGILIRKKVPVENSID